MILQLLLAGLALYFAYILNRFVVKPYFLRKFYEKQGGLVYPGFNMLENMKHDARTKQHQFAFQKEALKQNPQLQFICAQLGDTVVVNILQPHLFKELTTSVNTNCKIPDIMSKNFGEICPNGLFFAPYPIWKKHRRIASSILRYDLLQSLVPTIEETSTEIFEKLIHDRKLTKVDIRKELQKVSGEITSRSFLGKHMPSNQELAGKTITEAMSDVLDDGMCISMSTAAAFLGDKFVKLELLHQHKEFYRKLREIRKYSAKIIDKRRKEFNLEDLEKKPRKDILDAFLETEASNIEDKLPTEELVDEYLMLFLAGMDTTSHLVSIMLYYYARHPEYQAEIKKEIEQVVGKSKITQEILGKLTFITAFIKETLRIASPAPSFFIREAVQDHQLGSINIKKGTLILPTAICLGMNEKLFPNPDRFDATRWLGNDAPDKQDPFAFIPFSAGPKNCIGQHMAMNMAKIELIVFLRLFDYKLPEDYKMVLAWKFTYDPIDPILLDLKPKLV